MDLPPSFHRFSGEPFYHFGIDEARFSWDEREPQLILRLGHFRIPGLVEIRFSGVVHYAVMSESYLCMHAEDAWVEHTIIAEAGASQLCGFLAKYTLVESMRGTAADLRHFRVFTQSFFVDIVAPTAPIIAVIDDA